MEVCLFAGWEIAGSILKAVSVLHQYNLFIAHFIVTCRINRVNFHSSVFSKG